METSHLQPHVYGVRRELTLIPPHTASLSIFSEVYKCTQLLKPLVNDGKSTKIGTPVVEGAKVVAKVEKQGKEKKVVTFKYKPKKHSHTKYGHRQPYTKVTIESIEA